MSEYARYYEESLYPMQDGVLRRLARAFAPISERAPFLTGGTALSRRHFGHRYSDDLGFFLINDPEYAQIVETALVALSGRGYSLESGSLRRLESFSQFVISANDVRLKIDFVNDVAPRFGQLETWDLYPRVDCLRNMLSNKITALYRLEPKDVADLREIALHHCFHWSDAMREAEAKEAGIDAPTVAEPIMTFPRGLFDSVQWRLRPDPERFSDDLGRMARDMLELSPNSLAGTDSR